MTRGRIGRRLGGLVVAALCAAPATVMAQDTLAAARELYAAADYENALAALNRMQGVTHPADELRTIDQYRAFCLLALNRTDEADRAIESVVAADPAYQPSADVSPRVRAAFADVRRRTLPSIVEQQYAQAKAAYDRKDYAAASTGFARVVKLLADPDLEQAAHESPLADLGTLASGFRELSAKAAAPPPPPPAPAPPAPAVAAAPPPPPRIYGLGDAGVTAPAAISQTLPPFRGRVLVPTAGVIEVIVDETGSVESASMRVPVNAEYDVLALAAARTWRFKPATLNGKPVKFRRLVQITLKPGDNE